MKRETSGLDFIPGRSFAFSVQSSLGLLPVIAAPLLIFAVAWARPPTAALLATLVSLSVFLAIFRLVELLQKPAKAEYQYYLHSRKK